MKIVITGATGFVGRMLVDRLAAQGASLLIVSRDPERARTRFPTLATCSYGDLAEAARGFDLLVHLAVLNNDANASDADFERANVVLLQDVADSAKVAGVRRFLNVSTVHALGDHPGSGYARSKRLAVERLSGVTGLDARTVYLPLVWGERWAGQLAALNRLPRILANRLFMPLAALKPTVHVERLAQAIMRFDLLEDGAIISDGQGNNSFYRFSKRFIDLIFALTMALFFWWALAILWAIVRFTSPGPGLFIQDRVGKDGKIFTCYKFRTMQTGTPSVATHEASISSITPVGRFLRATKLDELPQILNIFRNEISLIGPRPCLPSQGALIEARRERGVLSLKPGISGLAQVNDIDMSVPIRLAQWDARYLALQSLVLDLKIGLSTAVGRGRGDRTQGETKR